jgi:hypothetical protein
LLLQDRIGSRRSLTRVLTDAQAMGRDPRPAATPPRDTGAPVFAEPWQAFALAVKLSEAAHFTWSELAAALGTELKAAAGCGEPDDGLPCYHNWARRAGAPRRTKRPRRSGGAHRAKEAWADAYRHTPHGQPVELGTGQCVRLLRECVAKLGYVRWIALDMIFLRLIRSRISGMPPTRGAAPTLGRRRPLVGRRGIRAWQADEGSVRLR